MHTHLQIIAEAHKERLGFGSKQNFTTYKKSRRDHVLDITKDRFNKANILTEDELNG